MVESLVEGLPERDGVAVDAGYGAVLTVLLSFVPFSSVLGGPVAAGRGERGYPGGFGVGLVAGVFAAVPLFALFVPALAVAGALGFGVPHSSPAYGVFIALVGLFFLVYTVGVSAIGGVIGIVIREQTDWELDPSRWVCPPTSGFSVDHEFNPGNATEDRYRSTERVHIADPRPTSTHSASGATGFADRVQVHRNKWGGRWLPPLAHLQSQSTPLRSTSHAR